MRYSMACCAGSGSTTEVHHSGEMVQAAILLVLIATRKCKLVGCVNSADVFELSNQI